MPAPTPAIAPPAIPTLDDPAIVSAISNARIAFQSKATKVVSVDGKGVTIPYPYPSPADWRETWIYFLMTDRFNNPNTQPNSGMQSPPIAWNQTYNFRQGGTFKGIEAQLDYIAGLGARAVWISPVLKNSLPDTAPDWPYNYHGYATQDFLSIDGRFATDGTSATAAKELTSLVEAAHARGIRIVLDIVINHSAEVFKYIYQGRPTDAFSDGVILNGPLGDEPPIQWIDGSGAARAVWQDTRPAGANADDAVWPADLQAHLDFFRRRGSFFPGEPPPGGYIKGDFGSMRQLVAEYVAASPAQLPIRIQYGQYPVINILIRIYTYLVAAFDIDAFRIDTVMYVEPDMVRNFGNAMREFGLGIGKQNFFLFGEIDDANYSVVDQFVGRNTTDDNGKGLGIDAALDYPLFDQLPGIIKGFSDVSNLRQLFLNRKNAEKDLITSHGEAGKYFVGFLDNHDQYQRFNTPGTPRAQVLMGLAILFTLQDIPCLYYGTEQGLTGTVNPDGTAASGAFECVREALWGKSPGAFDTTNPFYVEIAKLGKLRNADGALQFGRLYFREVAVDKINFGQSFGVGGLLAFSRILYDREVLIVANTGTTTGFEGWAVMDIDINRLQPLMTVAYSNFGTPGAGNVQIIPNANFYANNNRTTADTAAVYIKLAPMEVQILTPS
ncbi:MAG TPA: alpha-amylase family glycosyl hydrolase [Puia sp.]|nr:alpha-amylase family glycosyl hydrolase [Puia sp.]